MSEQFLRNEQAWSQNAQESLSKLSVAVIGTDSLSQYVLMGLAGLGVGRITIFGDESPATDSVFALIDKKKPANKACAEITELMNCAAQVYYAPPSLKKPELRKFSYSHVIAGNLSTEQVQDAQTFAQEHKARFLCGRITDTHAVASINTIDDGPLGKCPGLDGIIAGIICEEMRKDVFRYGTTDEKMNASVTYSPNDKTRKEQNNRTNFVLSRSRRAVVVGAGGIGNFASLALALTGIGELTIIDGDTIELTNLNRQPLYFGKSGEQKATALAERLQSIDAHAKYIAYPQHAGSIDQTWLREIYEIDAARASREGITLPWSCFEDFVKIVFGTTFLDEKILDKIKPDVIFGCVDNKYARLLLDHYCVSRKLMYVDGGTTARAGRVNVYVPGLTSPIASQCQLHNIAPTRKPQSCGEVLSPGVVMSNMIVGSAMVCEWLASLANPMNTLSAGLHYDALDSRRIYVG